MVGEKLNEFNVSVPVMSPMKKSNSRRLVASALAVSEHPPSAHCAHSPSGNRSLLETNEALIRELFDLQDLDGNGFIEEFELIRLNEKISWLHHGRGVDREALRKHYTALFRSSLDPDGRPVPFEPFRKHIHEVLRGLDPDPRAQEMILQQFIAEAECGRAVMDCSSRERTPARTPIAEEVLLRVFGDVESSRVAGCSPRGEPARTSSFLEGLEGL